MKRRRGCYSGHRVHAWLVKEVTKYKERLIGRLSRCLVDEGECKVWVPTGSQTQEGYGRISVWFEGAIVKFYIHHVFWTLMNQRPIPDGMEVDHTCSNRRCVKHLTLVTVRENLDSRNDRQRATAA